MIWKWSTKKMYEVVLKNYKLFPSLTLSKLQFSLAPKHLFFPLFLRSFSKNKNVHMSIISEQCIYLYAISMWQEKLLMTSSSEISKMCMSLILKHSLLLTSSFNWGGLAYMSNELFLVLVKKMSGCQKMSKVTKSSTWTMEEVHK